MPNDDNGNIFHDDDALDYIMYEECEKGAAREQGGNGKGGCLGVLILLVVPVGLYHALPVAKHLGMIYCNTRR